LEINIDFRLTFGLENARALNLAARQFSQEIWDRWRPEGWDGRLGTPEEAFGWKRAASDHALVTKVVSDIPVEVGSFDVAAIRFWKTAGGTAK